MKKRTPSTTEIPANFYPQPFDTCIVGGADEGLSAVINKRRIDITYLPHKNDPRSGPRFIIIYAEISTFSPPWSPRTRDGVPYILVADRNSSRTVPARLLVLARRAVI